ncbi:hypothetical protein Syun_028057 [Stephania yunnanensis]|uniref:Uncharacterized protein n=1 Tax=Stephania yunnanensis TaxID=152371 RepID=A0AAP0EGN4_9MAGN
MAMLLNTNGGLIGTFAKDYTGKAYHLNFYSHLDFYSFGEELHAVTGIIDAQVSILFQEFPLAIYRVDKLLLPPDIFMSTLHPLEVSPGSTTPQTTGWFEYSSTVSPAMSTMAFSPSYYFNADVQYPTSIFVPMPPADEQYPSSSFVPSSVEEFPH